MEIRSLKNSSDYELCCAWQRAFVDYGMSATNEQLIAMFKRRGYDSNLSFGAFTESNEFVSMTLNGIGYFNGVLSAYDTSTGTAVEFRKQGLASRIFHHMKPALQARGVQQYILEVLQDNEAAKALYVKIGFTITREFNCYRQSIISIRSTLSAVHRRHKSTHIRDIELPTFNMLQCMWDFNPSWQNSYESVQRSISSFRVVGAFAPQHDQGQEQSVEELVGYAVVEIGSGDIPQIAVHPSARRQGIGMSLLSHIIHIDTTDTTNTGTDADGAVGVAAGAVLHGDVLKVVNVPVDAVSLCAFLQKCGMLNFAGQFEMKLPI